MTFIQDPIRAHSTRYEEADLRPVVLWVEMVRNSFEKREDVPAKQRSTGTSEKAV
jgi:hypothetical protein